MNTKEFIINLNRSLKIAKGNADSGDLSRPNVLVYDSNIEEVKKIVSSWAAENGVNIVERDISSLAREDILNLSCEIEKPNTVLLLDNYNDYSNDYGREFFRKLAKDAILIDPLTSEGEVPQNYLFTIAIYNSKCDKLIQSEKAWFTAISLPMAYSYVNLGGVTDEHVVRFLFRILFGEEYRTIINAKGEEDIICACLRAACGPAFSHVTENTPLCKNKVINYKTVITPSSVLYKVFLDFCNSYSSASKAQLLDSNDTHLKKFFNSYKAISGAKALCFGHFQKLFNLALKLYICVYTFSSILKIPATMGTIISIQAMINADCPIDSKIIAVLVSKYKCSQFKGVNWSQLCGSSGVNTYIDLQKEIGKHYAGSNLLFDFEEWL